MKKNSLLLTGLLTLGFLSSCSNSDDSTNKSTESKTMTLSISGASYGNTRTSGTSPTDESTVKNLIVAIFDGSTVENILTIQSPEVSSGVITQKITYKASTPIIKVIANVPASTFSNITTVDGFNAALANLDNTTGSYSSDGTFTPAVGSNTSVGHQSSDILPMIGTAGSIGSNGIASVSLYRMISRISIGNVCTAFSGPYEGWKLKIDQIFIANAPTNSTFSSIWDTNGGNTAATTSSLMQGETTNENNYKSYLGSGLLASGGVDATTSAYTTNHYFYVFPNKSTIFSSQTKLIIKAELYDNNGADQGTFYYPIVVNRAQSGTTFNTTSIANDGTVKANVTYAITASISGKGVSNATDDLKPADINLSVSVSDWSAELTQDVKFY